MTQKKMKIKKGDQVIVIAGKDKGKKGSVLSVMRDKDRVLVSGINMIKRHQKAGPQGNAGIISKEAGIHVSNVALVDPKDGKATRVGYKTLSDGKKVRISRRTEETLA